MPSLRLGFSWTLVGNASYALSQWLIVAVLAKLSAPEQLGQYSLAWAIATPVFLFTNMNLRAAQASDAANRIPFERYVGTRLFASGLAAVLTCVFGIAMSDSLATFKIILVVIFLKFVDSMHDVFYGHLQQREMMQEISHSLIARGLLSLAMVGGFLWLTNSLPVALFAVGISWVVVFIAVDFRHKLRIGRLDLSILRLRLDSELLKLGTPLAIVAILDSLNVNLPKYVLQAYHGESAVGVYTALTMLIMTGGIVLSALGNTAMPRMASYVAQGEFKRLTNLVYRLLMLAVGIGLLASVAAFVAGPRILELVYNREIAAHARAFQLLMLAAAIWYAVTIISFTMYSLRVFQQQVWMYIGMDLVTLVVSLLLIPHMGVYGAVAAFGCGVIIRTCWSVILIRRSIRLLRPTSELQPVH